jgi:hypothetical protein
MRSDAGPVISREFLSAYISGYADGEGCFSISIAPRATLAVGWEVRPSFSVSQNRDRAEVLHALQDHFGCGSIRPDRSDKTLNGRRASSTRSSSGSSRTSSVIRCCPQNSLTSSVSPSSVFGWVDGEHRSRLGLLSIVSIVREMNPDGRPALRRRRALEFATSNTGEGIVCALGNEGITRSSDLHEWSNDLGAVSTRDPVKL